MLGEDKKGVDERCGKSAFSFRLEAWETKRTPKTQANKKKKMFNLRRLDA